MRHSHTSIELYHQCPRRYFYERVLKLPTPDGLPLVVGSLYHDVLETLLKVPSLTFPEAVDGAMEKAKDATERLQVDVADLRAEILENLTKVDFEHIAPVYVGLQPLVERWFTNNDLNYCGKIDLICRYKPIVTEKGDVKGWVEEPCVLDFKVLSSKRRKTQRDAMVSAQLASYCLETGINTAGFYEIPRNLEKPHRVRLATFTQEELREWATWRKDQCHSIQRIHEASSLIISPRDLFPMTPRTNALCSRMWCPFWDKCYGKQGDT